MAIESRPIARCRSSGSTSAGTSAFCAGKQKAVATPSSDARTITGATLARPAAASTASTPETTTEATWLTISSRRRS